MLLAAAAGLLVWRHATEGAAHPVAWRDLTGALGQVEFPRPVSVSAGSTARLTGPLQAAMPGRAVRRPPIDFGRDLAVLLATGPRSSTGYGVRVVSVTDDGDRFVVLAREETPTLGDPVTARITYPHRLIVFPRQEQPVTIRWQNRP